jgi:hypothetical protein
MVRLDRNYTRGEWGVIGFTGAYLLVSIVAACVVRNFEFLFYIAVMLVMVEVVRSIHHRISLSVGVLWGLSLWGFAHMAGGLVPVPSTWPVNGESYVLYSLWLVPGVLKYDHVVHAYGFGVTTVVCWEGLCALLGRVKSSRPSFGMLLLCVAAGMGFGALNEVIEFAATLLVPETNVGGYFNTGWDMVANLVGTMGAAVLIWLRGKASD